jgi:hypothetical protein
MNALNLIQEQSGICRRLRTKTSFGTFIGSASFWEDGDSTTAVYWCLDTMGASAQLPFRPRVFQVPGLDQVTGSPFHLMLFTFPFLEIRFVTALAGETPTISSNMRA